jgi:hypothetical protein
MTAFTQDDTRTLVFQLLADWRAGLSGQPNLLTVYDQLGLEPGDPAPSWVRRIWYDAVSGLTVETAPEYLTRIGVPTPVRYRDDPELIADAAERGRSAIADPRDPAPTAHLTAQARAVRSFWARTRKDRP